MVSRAPHELRAPRPAAQPLRERAIGRLQSRAGSAGTPLAETAGMSILAHDRLDQVATQFVRTAGVQMREEAEAAIHCYDCGSTLGTRHHLTTLRQLAERSARIERYLLHSSSSAAQLKRAADAALSALDVGSPARVVRALARVEALAS
jgi:hypothetical protein